MKSVGIDIGSYSVKVAEVEAGSKGFSVGRLQEFTLSPDPSKDHHLEVVDFLRNLAAEYDPHLTRFTLAVRLEHVSLRTRVFPFRERHKILKSIAFELEDDIPFSQFDAVFDAKITRYIGNAAEILAVACPKEHVKELLQTASDGTIDPEVVSVDGLALSNLFEDWQEVPTHTAEKESDEEEEDRDEKNPPPPIEPDPARIVIDIGHTTTHLLIYRGNVLVTARNVDWGAKNIVRAVGAKYGIQYVEALKEYKNKAYVLLNKEGVTKEQIAYSEIVKTVIDELAHELKLTILEVQSEYDIQIKEATMTGGTSRLKNLGAYLTQKLEIPFNRLKSSPAVGRVDFASEQNNEIVFPVALGLAIEGIKRPRNPAVNLRKDDFARESEGMKVFWTKWGHTVKIATAAMVLLFTYAVLKDMFAADLADQAHNLLRDQARNTGAQELKGAKANLRNIRRYLREQKRTLKNRELAEKVQDINSAMDILAELSSSLPSPEQIQLDVKSFEIKNRQVTLQGLVSRAQSVSQVESALRRLAAGGKVEKVNPKITGQAGKRPFAFQFNVDRHRGN